MRWATFLVPTHYRPELLRACLKHLHRQDAIPEGWNYECLVVARADDPAWDVCRDTPRVRMVGTDAASVGEKLNVGLWSARGEVICCSGDDDLQGPNRIADAIVAHEAGHVMSTGTSVWVYHLERDLVCKRTSPPGLIGTLSNWSTAWFRRYGGWPDVPRCIDSAMIDSLAEDLVPMHDIDQPPECVVLKHAGAMTPLWWPPANTTVVKGETTISGFGKLAGDGVAVLPPLAVVTLHSLRTT